MCVELKIFTRKVEVLKKRLHIFVVKKCKPNTTETENGDSAVHQFQVFQTDICVPSSVISEIIINNNSIEDCMHHTFPSYCRERMANDTKWRTWLRNVP
jgi:hypothetical protein